MPKKHTTSNKTRKRKGKDLDEIHEDLIPEKAAKLLKQDIDLEMPGNAQFYCIECNRYFIDDDALAKHKFTKGKNFLAKRGIKFEHVLLGKTFF